MQEVVEKWFPFIVWKLYHNSNETNIIDTFVNNRYLGGYFNTLDINRFVNSLVKRLISYY